MWADLRIVWKTAVKLAVICGLSGSSTITAVGVSLGIQLVGGVSRADDGPATVNESVVYGLHFDLPAPPPGYANQGAILAAYQLGNLALVNVKNPNVPQGVREETDVEYGNVKGRSLKLDIDLPDPSPATVPGLIFIHGGAWSGGERTIYHAYMHQLAQRGFAAATISYRLSGEAPFPAAVEDAKCAVRWMRRNAAKYHIDPSRLAVLGGSAGGHLAMMVGYSQDPALEGDGGHAGVSSRVAAVVSLYGPADLTTDAARKARSVQKFIGGSYDQLGDAYRLASPLYHLDAEDPPTLIIHGTMDDVVSIQQSDRLAGELRRLSVRFAYDRIPGWPHTMDLAAIVNEHCVEVMSRFLRETLGPQNQ